MGNLDRLDTLPDGRGWAPNNYDGRQQHLAATLEIQSDGSAVKTNDKGRVLAAEHGGWEPHDCTEENPLLCRDHTRKDRCDIREYNGVPSPTDLAAIIEANEPVMFRGAALNWVWPVRRCIAYLQCSTRSYFGNVCVLVLANPRVVESGETFGGVRRQAGNCCTLHEQPRPGEC